MIQLLGIMLIVNTLVVSGWWLGTNHPWNKGWTVLVTMACVAGIVLILHERASRLSFDKTARSAPAVSQAGPDPQELAALKERIQSLSAAVGLAALEAQKAKKLAEETENKNQNAEQKLSDLDAAIAKAKGALSDLNAAGKITVQVAQAQSDDRAAFNQLVKMGYDKDSRYAAQIQSILAAIVETVERETVARENLAWEWGNFGIDPQNTSLQQFKELYSKSLYPPLRFAIVREVFNDARFSEPDRYDFLVTVMEQDNSLTVLQESCRLMDKKRKSRQNFTAVDAYLLWHQNYRTKLAPNAQP